jgi:hypothetical protein
MIKSTRTHVCWSSTRFWSVRCAPSRLCSNSFNIRIFVVSVPAPKCPSTSLSPAPVACPTTTATLPVARGRRSRTPHKRSGWGSSIRRHSEAEPVGGGGWALRGAGRQRGRGANHRRHPKRRLRRARHARFRQDVGRLERHHILEFAAVVEVGGGEEGGGGRARDDVAEEAAAGAAVCRKQRSATKHDRWNRLGKR